MARDPRPTTCPVCGYSDAVGFKNQGLVGVATVLRIWLGRCERCTWRGEVRVEIPKP